VAGAPVPAIPQVNQMEKLIKIYKNGKQVGEQNVDGWSQQEIDRFVSQQARLLNRTCIIDESILTINQ